MIDIIPLHFLRPFWLFAFIPIMLYGLWSIYYARDHNPWRAICDPHLLPVLLQYNHTTRRAFYTILFVLLGLIIFALAGPSWKKTKIPVFRDLSSLMVILDLSSNMLNADIQPNRLARAKFKIRDLIQLSKNTQMGLVVFSGEAFVVTPLSQDANTLNGMLEELHPQMMPLTGSNMGQGLTQALALVQQSQVPPSNILLITASEPNAQSWTAAKAIQAAGHQLNILAVLTQTVATENTIKALRQLAQIGGGSFYLFKPDGKDIQYLLNNGAAQIVKDQNINYANLWQDAGPWLCLLLVPLTLLVLREKL